MVTTVVPLDDRSDLNRFSFREYLDTGRLTQPVLDNAIEGQPIPPVSRHENGDSDAIDTDAYVPVRSIHGVHVHRRHDVHRNAIWFVDQLIAAATRDRKEKHACSEDRQLFSHSRSSLER